MSKMKTLKDIKQRMYPHGIIRADDGDLDMVIRIDDLRDVAKEHVDILKKELKDLTKQVKKLGDTDSRKIGLGMMAAKTVAKMEWIKYFFNLEEK